MPSLRPTKTLSSSLAATTGLLMASSAVGADMGSSSNVVAYWGQNSFGQAAGPQSQQNLATYCANTDLDIIPLAFMISMTGGYNARSNSSVNSFDALNQTSPMNETSIAGEQRMVVNFANTGNNCSIFSGTTLLDCADTIGKDIQTCQDEYNKTILLSIGGATYTEGGFSSEDAAISAAEMVWRTFGPASDASNSIDVNSPAAQETITTTMIASNALTTRTITLTLTQDAVAATEASSVDAAGVTVMVSGAPPILTSSRSVAGQQQPAGTGVAFDDTTSTSESVADGPTDTPTGTTTENPGSALNPSATATSTGNDQMDTATIPTVNPRASATANGTLLSVVTTTVFRTSTTTFTAGASAATVASDSSVNNISDASARLRRRQEVDVLRPFGDAVIDGFDIDLESTTQNFLPFVRRLRELMDGDATKQYYLTAAPQCPYPDAAVSHLLDSEVRFDAVFVQFYNNYCGVQSYDNATETQTNFNFEAWDTWAKNASSRWAAAANGTGLTKRQSAPAPADVKVFLGVPGGRTGAGSGFATLEQLTPVVEYSKKFSSFGGVMMWDVSQAEANSGFLAGVKELVAKKAEEGGATTSSAAATASATDAVSSSEILASTTELAVTSASDAATTSATEAVTSSAASEAFTSASDALVSSTASEAAETSSAATDASTSATEAVTSSPASGASTSASDALVSSTASEAAETSSAATDASTSATEAVTSSPASGASTSASDALVSSTASEAVETSSSASDAAASSSVAQASTSELASSASATSSASQAASTTDSAATASEAVASIQTGEGTVASASNFGLPSPTSLVSSAGVAATSSLLASSASLLTPSAFPTDNTAASSSSASGSVLDTTDFATPVSPSIPTSTLAAAGEPTTLSSSFTNASATDGETNPLASAPTSSDSIAGLPPTSTVSGPDAAAGVASATTTQAFASPASIAASPSSASAAVLSNAAATPSATVSSDPATPSFNVVLNNSTQVPERRRRREAERVARVWVA